MNEKLADELTEGMVLARNLVIHLQSMNAESAKIPVSLGGQDYTVCVSPGKTQETDR